MRGRDKTVVGIVSLILMIAAVVMDEHTKNHWWALLAACGMLLILWEVFKPRG